jgi:hypothetical protein
MKVAAVSILFLESFRYAHGFSSTKVNTPGTAKAQDPVELKDWNEQVTEPSPLGGRRYGPNWTIDPETLGPKQVSQKCGAMVWALGDSTFEHPEQRTDLPVGKWLQTRSNLGICMSGGGLRAATCALGWYRALNHLNLLTKASYIGANSGATWTTLPLYCRQMLEKKDDNVEMDYARFLGEYLEPEDLVFDKEPYGFMGKVLEESDILEYQANEENPFFTAWCDSIDQNFVEPVMDDWKPDKNWKNDFWLELSDAYLWNIEEKNDLLNENSFPFPIFCATVFDERNSDENFPMEITPLYSGIPTDPRSLGVDTDFGGGFVQGVALNSKGLEDSSTVSPDSEKLNFKEFELPSPVVKVSELTGASSNFLGGTDSMTNIKLTNPFFRGVIKLFLPLISKVMGFDYSGPIIKYLEPGRYKWWSPTTGGDSVELAFVDGGLYDNLGALAVLRRGVSTLVICDACDTDLLTVKKKDIPKKYYDVAFLFGVGASFIPPLLQKKSYTDTVNERSQVFAKEEFKILINEMKELQREGKPLVVRKKLTLIPNKYAGIQESREVDVIFCFNGKVKEFEDRAEEPKNPGENFPYLSTFDTDFNLEDVNRLSSLCSYNLVEGLKNVDFDIDQVEKSIT